MQIDKELNLERGKMTTTKLVVYGIGIRRATYFKLMYPIYSGEDKYSILHLAVFGRN